MTAMVEKMVSERDINGNQILVARRVPAPAPKGAKSKTRTEPEAMKPTGDSAADQLRLFIERVERLEEERQGIVDDIKDVYSEAKANGYDVKTMRTIVRLRKMEPHHRLEAEALLETYKASLGIE